MVLEHPLWAPGPDGAEFQHSALLDRRLVQAVFRTGGVLTSHAINALQVVQRAAGANMSVDIQAGMCVVPGTSIGNQGHYLCRSTAVENRSVAAAPGSGTRTDTVVARVRDSSVTGTQDGFFIEVLNGTTTVPDDAIELARITVSAGNSSVTNAMITDRRQPASTGGGPLAIIKYESSGTFVKADYPWLRAVRARVQGGGGAGGGAQTATSGNSSLGRGGAGSAYAERLVTVDSLGASETVTVGNGGAGASGSTGGSGGTSSFGSHVSAPGGTGGGTSSNASFDGVFVGLNGSEGGVGDLLVAGGPGGAAIRFSGDRNVPGAGGDSYLGGGGRVIGVAGSGEPGRGYGSGGSGAGSTGGDSSAKPGGNGGPGIVILELYA